eukprot:TRINITY_DN3459_c0_g1_i6.p1 TRINITY_DN3459_c0_g1~~TRINITY_DN3459_c0_g1_i6.p1  ORF type:complete len:663 (-),score=45.14 TRINITY_DN3459_c0_g1_i6:218-2206(-)
MVSSQNAPQTNLFDNQDLDYLRDKLGWDTDAEDAAGNNLSTISTSSSKLLDDRAVDRQYSAMTTTKGKTAVLETDQLSSSSKPRSLLKKQIRQHQTGLVFVEETDAPRSFIEEEQDRRPAPRPKTYDEHEFFPGWYRIRNFVELDENGNILDKKTKKQQLDESTNVAQVDTGIASQAKKLDKSTEKKINKQNKTFHVSEDEQGEKNIAVYGEVQEVLQDFMHPEELLQKLTQGQQVDPVEVYKIRRAYSSQLNQSPRNYDNWQPPFRVFDDFESIESCLPELKLPMKGQKTCHFLLEWRRDLPMPDTDFVSHLLQKRQVLVNVTITSDRDQVREWLMKNLWYPTGAALASYNRRKRQGRRPKRLMRSELPQVGVRIFWRNCHKPESWDANDPNDMSVIVFANMRNILIVQLDQMTKASRSINTALCSEHIIKIGHNFKPQQLRYNRRKASKTQKVREAYSFLQYAYRLDGGIDKAPPIFDQVDFYEAAGKLLGIHWSEMDESVASEIGNESLSPAAIAYLCRKTYPLLPFYMAFFKITRRKAFAIANFLETHARQSYPPAGAAADRPEHIFAYYRRDKKDYSDGWDEEDVLQELELQKQRELRKLEKQKKIKKKKATIRKEFIKQIKLDLFRKRKIPGGPKNRYIQENQFIKLHVRRSLQPQ